MLVIIDRYTLQTEIKSNDFVVIEKVCSIRSKWRKIDRWWLVISGSVTDDHGCDATYAVLYGRQLWLGFGEERRELGF